MGEKMPRPTQDAQACEADSLCSMPSQPGLAPYPAATTHGLTTGQGRGGENGGEVQKKAQRGIKNSLSNVTPIYNPVV